MARILTALLILSSFAFSSNLLTHNIYERSDRVDIMLSFDSPYEGRITQKRGENITTLTLNDLSYDKLIEKNINSKIIQAITIEPNAQSLRVILKSSQNIAVIASKTVDGFGLRVRAKPIAIKKQSPISSKKTVAPAQANTQQTSLSNILGEGTSDLVDSRYIMVLTILFILLLVMLWVKNKVTKASSNIQTKKNSWLFNKSENQSLNKEVQVLHKKAIDQQNSVVLLEFEGKKYLVMTGSSNLLLEKFSGDEIQDNSDFEQAFEENRKKLDDYLKIQNSSMDSYKSKVSGDLPRNLESY